MLKEKKMIRLRIGRGEQQGSGKKINKPRRVYDMKSLLLEARHHFSLEPSQGLFARIRFVNGVKARKQRVGDKLLNLEHGES